MGIFERGRDQAFLDELEIDEKWVRSGVDTTGTIHTANDVDALLVANANREPDIEVSYIAHKPRRMVND